MSLKKLDQELPHYILHPTGPDVCHARNLERAWQMQKKMRVFTVPPDVCHVRNPERARQMQNKCACLPSRRTRATLARTATVVPRKAKSIPVRAVPRIR